MPAAQPNLTPSCETEGGYRLLPDDKHASMRRAYVILGPNGINI